MALAPWLYPPGPTDLTQRLAQCPRCGRKYTDVANTTGKCPNCDANIHIPADVT